MLIEHKIKIKKKEISHKDLCYILPNKYENRKELVDKNINPEQIYIFKFYMDEINELNKKQINIIGTTNNNKIKIIHSIKLVNYFKAKKVLFLKGIIKNNICFFPDLFDLRLGIVATYTNFTQSSLNKRKEALMTIEDEFLRTNLSLIHFPSTIENITTGFRNLLIMEIICFLLILHEKKEEKQPISCKSLEEITSMLPFELSKSQNLAIKDIKKDLESTKTVHRLIYGDVGSGKTAVAFCALQIVLKNSTQKIVVLSPTSLLSEQIFNKFKEFDSKMKIQLVNSKTKEYDEECDVFVGTHALLHRKLYFKVGLVIIDEQHRFGVNQRNLLPKDHQADVLMMTATPIPRTMEMLTKGYIEVSKLDSHKETNIKTYVVSIKKRKEYISKLLDLSREKLVLWVLRSIKEAEEMYEELKDSNPNIFLIHGKLKEKEKILENYGKQEGAFLISTTVIEVGIDLNIKAVVIESAENFGLAQIHQIRGRSGRRKEEGICILLGENLRRLRLIKEATSGFEISQIDLERRGHGMIHSQVQSGFDNFHFAKTIDKNLNIISYEIQEEDVAKAQSIDIRKFNLKEIKLFFALGEEIGV